MSMPIETPKELLSVEFSYREKPLVVTRGSALPAGPVATPAGINFVLLCRHGTAVWLVLSEPCNAEIHAEIPLDPRKNRTGDHWHIRVDGLPDGILLRLSRRWAQGSGPSLRPPHHPASTRMRGLCRAAAPGAPGATCRGAA